MNLTSNNNWGGARQGAGRNKSIERKSYPFYLSKEECLIHKELFTEFRKFESDTTRDIAKNFKCKQNEIQEDVYTVILEARKKIIGNALEELKQQEDKIKMEIIKNLEG